MCDFKKYGIQAHKYYHYNYYYFTGASTNL